LIYCPTGKHGWDLHTFITPTPFLLNEDTIRIYGGSRDAEGISRITWIDVDAKNPSVIKRLAGKPCLDTGKPGTFDDNGVILGSVIRANDGIRMYYVGFQLVKNVKFLAYSGLAISIDGGNTFTRHSDTPVLDRYMDELYIRAIHSVLYEGGRYRIWYSTGNRWEIINGKPYPQYKIMYTESADGINIPGKGELCIDVTGDEYRIGRPTVFREDGIYKMFYTRDTLSKIYSPGYAESENGITWERKDSEMGLKPSAEGWDSQMVCYPVPLKTKTNYYLFYSGNNMGETGVGYAVRS
jgi:hypothetical protein